MRENKIFKTGVSFNKKIKKHNDTPNFTLEKSKQRIKNTTEKHY